MQFLVGSMLALAFWTTGIVKKPQLNMQTVSHGKTQPTIMHFMTEP